MSKELGGVFAPITTPFVDETVAYDQLKSNIKKYSASALAGFFALGSNGESKCLTDTEKLKVLDVILEEKGPGQIVMAGTGKESTRQSIAFSKEVAVCGADFVSVVTPSYFKKRLTDEVLIKYYLDIAEAVTIPVVAYNAPGFTGVTLSAKVVREISKHPNIAAMKDTSKGNMSNYLSVCDDSFNVLSGSASTLFNSMLLGATGGVVSLANAFPALCCDFYEKCRAGDHKEAKKLHFLIFRLNQAVSGSFGVAGVKYAMEVAGFYGGAPRLPLAPMTSEGKKSIDAAIAAAGLH
ncbi:MAG: dihydrodipicolinate synthase family protein [Thermodesulfobacteriota bacterium]